MRHADSLQTQITPAKCKGEPAKEGEAELPAREGQCRPGVCGGEHGAPRRMTHRGREGLQDVFFGRGRFLAGNRDHNSAARMSLPNVRHCRSMSPLPRGSLGALVVCLALCGCTVSVTAY